MSLAGMASGLSTAATASVLDFDCIYSYDIQRKRQKRWHDGFLRFHAFNRRVMVYDVPRNFIGDTHLKGADFIQDGDELHLDRGVLVEVGESRGSAAQDVTPLFERKRVQHRERPMPARQPPKGSALLNEASQEVQQPRRSDLPNVTTQGSSPMRGDGFLRPKSLNVVLGPRMGIQGRAVVAKKSPCEKSAREESTLAAAAVEPPAKKQRTSETTRSIGKVQSAHGKERAEERHRLSSRVNDCPNQPTVLEQAARPTRRVEHSNLSSPRPSRDSHTIQSARRLFQSADLDIPTPEATKDTASTRLQGRPTSRLQVANSKRSKLMCVKPQAPRSSERQGTYNSPSPKGHDLQRRAPLRVSTLEELSSSPSGTNWTVMAFPTSQGLGERDPTPPGQENWPEANKEPLDLPQEEIVAVPQPPGLHDQPKDLLPQSPLQMQTEEPEDGARKVLSGSTPSGLIALELALPLAPAPLPPIVREISTTTTPLPALASVGPTTGPVAGPSRPPLVRKMKQASLLVEPPTASNSTLATSTTTEAPSQAAPTRVGAASATTEVHTTSSISATSPATVTMDSETGPWSRTAFDLFGFLPPAGVDVGKTAGRKTLDALKKRCKAMRGSTRGMMRECFD